jgi:hypothetical protein
VFIFTHNYWHLAVVEILLGNNRKAVEILNDKIYGSWVHPQNHVNVLLLLMYLNWAGVDILPLVLPELEASI